MTISVAPLAAVILSLPLRAWGYPLSVVRQKSASCHEATSAAPIMPLIGRRNAAPRCDPFVPPDRVRVNLNATGQRDFESRTV